ncbi:hypothetical protein [Scytonema sp. NUACC21]
MGREAHILAGEMRSPGVYKSPVSEIVVPQSAILVLRECSYSTPKSFLKNL